MAPKNANARLFVFFVGLILMILSVRSSDALTEGELLIQFKETLSNVSALTSWNISMNNPCTGNTQNWFGVRCANGAVKTLIFENMGLQGRINIDLLVGLPMLRSLSFMYNNLDGPLPDVKKLTSLRMLYLSANNFSGEIEDDAFSGMSLLMKLYIDRNQFVGKIPQSLVDLPMLTELSVAENGFHGKIPDFKQNNQLVFMDFADNQFEGRIPSSLSKLNPDFFTDNKKLCGAPLSTPCKKYTKLSLLKIHLLAGAGIALPVFLVILMAIAICRYDAKRAQLNQKPTSKLTKKSSSKYSCSNGGSARKEVYSPGPVQASNNHRKQEDQGRLSFVRDGVERFELNQLLTASAEVLGNGNFGSSYKAVLLSGSAMVVKRFRYMTNVGKEEFYEHMRRLGKLAHPNLLPLLAFYYKKEEKLIVSYFVEKGCLASHLHGTIGQPGLDWPTRLKVIKGVAKGLAYLYQEFPGFKLPHGHLNSSNVLLDSTFEPILMDYALDPIVDQEHTQQFMAAYKSPEYTQNHEITKKTDVWSLGILILELLTGKLPANFLKQEKGDYADLAAWVNSVVREDWTGEVFDKDMKNMENGEGEMLKLLKIGLDCCELNLEKRWDFKEAVEKIEGLKERDSGEDSFSYASEGDIFYSSRASEVDWSFSATK